MAASSWLRERRTELAQVLPSGNELELKVQDDREVRISFILTIKPHRAQPRAVFICVKDIKEITSLQPDGQSG